MQSNPRDSPLSLQLLPNNPQIPLPNHTCRKSHLRSDGEKRQQQSDDDREAFFQLHITSLWLSLLRDAERNAPRREGRKEGKAKQEDVQVELTFIRCCATCYSSLGVKCVLLYLPDGEDASSLQCSHPFSLTAPKWHGGGKKWGRDVKAGRKRNYQKSADIKERIKKPVEHDAAALCRSLPSPASNDTSFYSLCLAVLCDVAAIY